MSAVLDRLTVTAHGEGGKLATESFPLTVTGKVQLSSATVSVKNPETSSEKQQGQLQFSDSLSAPILLDHRSQLKVRAPARRALLGHDIVMGEVLMSAVLLTMGSLTSEAFTQELHACPAEAVVVGEPQWAA